MLERTDKHLRSHTAATVIGYLIRERGLTASQIADVLGVHRSFVSRCKAGERELATGNLRALADHMGMSIGALLLAAHPPRLDHPDPAVRRLERAAVDALEKLSALSEKIRQRRLGGDAADAA